MHSSKRWQAMSLKKKMAFLIGGLMIPMIILIGYLLFSSNSQRIAYDQIIRNITEINEYYGTFKGNIDSSMYAAVSGKLEFDELGTDDYSVPVYAYLDEVRENFDKVSGFTSTVKGKNQLRRLNNTLDTLEKRIREMEFYCGVSGHYDENIYSLDTNIYVLTEIIQQGMKDYTYYETENLESVRVKLEKQNKLIMTISILVVLILTVTMLALSIAITASITRPVGDLCEAARQIGKGDFSIRADTEAADEIAVLTESFNKMTEKIGNLVQVKEQQQQNLKKTEIKLLQAQINPHFLYNTLDAIVWLVEEQKTREAVQMVTSLSQFFRTTLSEGRDYVTVLEEENHVRSYLEIQQVRYQDIMEYDIDMDSDLYTYHVPKLLLQPLVENAIYHGIKNKRGIGRIVIRGIKRDTEMLFLVQDNGKGMSQEEIQQLRKKIENREEKEAGNFGLRNVNERIKTYYGESYGLTLEQNQGGGITVLVLLPLKDIIQIS